MAEVKMRAYIGAGFLSSSLTSGFTMIPTDAFSFQIAVLMAVGATIGVTLIADGWGGS